MITFPYQLKNRKTEEKKLEKLENQKTEKKNQLENTCTFPSSSPRPFPC